MPTKADILTHLRQIAGLLYDHQLATAGSRISLEAKAYVIDLVDTLDRLTYTDPFPEVDENGHTTLVDINAECEDEEHPKDETSRKLQDWCTNTAPLPPSPTPASAPLLHPGTTRMLDNLSRYKSGITRHRLTLLRAGDRPGKEAYTSARNAYTLAHAAYAARLSSGRVAATVEENETLEEHREALTETSGADFPPHIQATADYLRERLFGPTPPLV